MTEEDIIDILENVFIFKNTSDRFTDLDLNAIKGLLDLYNKQQKEIESIKEYVNSPEFLDWHLGFTQLDELEYRKNSINKLLEEK